MDTRFWMELTKPQQPKDPPPRPKFATIQQKFLVLDKIRHNRLPMMFDVAYLMEHEGLTQRGASQWASKMLRREAICAKPKDNCPMDTKKLTQMNFYKLSKEL